MLAPGSGWAVYCRMALISGGVRPGLACSSRAAVPATAGAATEVPLSSISSWSRVWAAPASAISAGYSVASRLPVGAGLPASFDTAPSRRLPGATRSGLIRLSTQRPRASARLPRVGPRELKPATTSSVRLSVALGLLAPTVMTDGSCPGEPTAPYSSAPLAALPALPAATTTTMPSATALRAARASGSTRNESTDDAARLMFMTRMLNRRARCTTQSMPASTSAMLPTPASLSTRTSYSVAFGATPVELGCW